LKAPSRRHVVFGFENLINNRRRCSLGSAGGGTARLFALSILVITRRFAVLTRNTLALRRALNASRVALAIPFEAVRILAIASLGMDDSLPFGYDLLLKSVRIIGLNALDGCKNIIMVKAVIFAVRTSTAFALLSRRKTIAIHLKAAALFAFAGYLV
jgi:hypothetical protein